MITRSSIHAVCFLLVTACSSFGANFTWTNDTTAAFSDNGAWLNGSPPTSTDTAFFTNLPAHTVNFTADATTAAMTVENSVNTFVLNDGTARTYTAGDLKWWPFATVVLTGDGTLISSGGNINFGNAGASTLIVTNGATWQNNSYLYGYGGTITVTGPGSKVNIPSTGAQLNNGITFVTVTDGARWDSGGEFTLNDGFLLLGGGTGVSTMKVATVQLQTYNYAAPDLTVFSNGLLDVTGSGIEVRDGHLGDASKFTIDGGKVLMRTNAVLGLRNTDQFGPEPSSAGLLRGTGTIQRRTAGPNFKVVNEGLIQPGDTTASPAIGTLTFDGGDLVQTNAAMTVAGLRLDFNPTVSGSADLLDFSGGSVTITAGTNIFNNTVAGPLVLGKWDFIKADSITYTGSDNMDALVASLGLPPVPPDAEYYFGVVTRDGFDFLELSVVPEPSTVALLGLASLLCMRRRRV